MSQLWKLNPPQTEAVHHLDGPVVVFAGAGSGKTRIITHRIAHLIRTHGIPPWEILAMTFTNKAAGEMRERAINLAPEAKRVMITTFHSACARWLREFAPELGFENNFVIFDDRDSTAVLKSLLKESTPKKELTHLTNQIKGFISWAKTKALLPNQLDQYSKYIKKSFPDLAPETYRKYQEALANQNAMDFGDLMMNMLLLLRRNKSVQSIMFKRYRYIMVDEFQDTNQAQMELIQKLSSITKNIFVVGDDDQSIYSWRGAVPENIINFNEFFPDSKQIKLEQNYRCSGNIVQAASALIQHNTHRTEKILFTDNPDGDLIECIQEKDGEMEAHTVATTITTELDTYPLQEIAIFYRTNSQSRLLEEALHRENIPYTIYGSLAFYDRLEVKDLLAYFKFIVNPKDNVSFQRILNTPPRGIGKKSLSEIESHANEASLSMYEAAKGFSHKPAIAKFLKLVEDLKSLLDIALSDALPTLEKAIGYKAYLEKKFPDQFQDKMENIHELGSAMATAERKDPSLDLNGWLESATLKRDENSNQPEEKSASLMTLHMAKGLEFNRVYLVGVEDGLLPHQNSLEDPQAIEEERRLLYVGITRAKEKLSILSSEVRQIFNQFLHHPPSRFMSEIPPQHLKSRNLNPHLDSEYTYDYDIDPNPIPNHEIKVGLKVDHPTFGTGIVREVLSNFGTNKILVDFFEFGPRKVRPSQLERF